MSPALGHPSEIALSGGSEWRPGGQPEIRVPLPALPCGQPAAPAHAR